MCSHASAESASAPLPLFGARPQIGGILKTLDNGRYDDKNGLNKVSNGLRLLGCTSGGMQEVVEGERGQESDGWQWHWTDDGDLAGEPIPRP